MLAQRASPAPSGVAEDVSESAYAVDALSATASFRAIVEQVTEQLASTLPLPSFEEWLSGYKESPDRYEQELLGFWKDGSRA